MANVRNGNTFYVDAASAGGTPASFINLPAVKVASITFTSSSAGDTITLADLNASSGNTAGATKITVRNVNATDSKFLNFYDYPLSFPNGLWVVAISASCTASIVLVNSGN